MPAEKRNIRTFLDKIPEPPQEDIKAAVQNLKEWIVKEPHMPNIDDDEWLTTFFYNNKFSLEKTKYKLDNYYSFRNKYPSFLKNRDVTAPWLEDYVPHMSISNRLTADGVRVFQIKYHLDMDKFNADDYFKIMMMSLDCLMLEKDRLTSYVLLIDLENYTYQHFLKQLTKLKGAAEVLTRAYTERVEAVYLFNAPSFTELAIKTFLPLFPEKYANRVFVNTASNNKFLEMFDEEDLPSDLGGKGPSWAECEKSTRSLYHKYKKWFEEQEDISTNEELRRKDDNQQINDLKGSFRKLEVD